jgi:uncharacterized repeat protein (TIGR03803 family)
VKLQNSYDIIKRAIAVAALLLASSLNMMGQYQVLHYFADNPAAGPEAGLVADSHGNLYGTAAYSFKQCGHFSCGIVFKLTRGSNAQWSYCILHEFAGPDGAKPMGTLLFDSDGNLYGTTEEGGEYGNGTVFELSESGGKWGEKVLYSFGGFPGDLGNPAAGLTLDTNGNLYGTAKSGGEYSGGGVFELTRANGGWKFQLVYACTVCVSPDSKLALDAAGDLYGTSQGSRDVFELVRTAAGGWIPINLTYFPSPETPVGGVIVDSAGNLYGVVKEGGQGAATHCGFQYGPGCGAIFEITPGKAPELLYSFSGPDGRTPLGGLVMDSGYLYGTTSSGGTNNQGTVFKYPKLFNGTYLTVLHNFAGADGNSPRATLLLGDDGVIYGTAFGGGVGLPQQNGVVFSLAP